MEQKVRAHYGLAEESKTQEKISESEDENV